MNEKREFFKSYAKLSGAIIGLNSVAVEKSLPTFGGLH